MNTATAARKAHVTEATIRIWARNGVIAATKTAGRWDIDETSLRQHRRLLRDLRNARVERAAARLHDRLASAITLPELAGTPKQIAWATDVRTRRIEQALRLVTHDDLGPRDQPLWQIATGPYSSSNPLRATGADVTAVHATAADYLAVLHAVLADANHTSAAWWINNAR